MAIFTEKGRTGDSSCEVHGGEGRHGGLLKVWPEQAALRDGRYIHVAYSHQSDVKSRGGPGRFNRSQSDSRFRCPVVVPWQWEPIDKFHLPRTCFGLCLALDWLW